MLLGSHNSWSYLSPKRWWMWLIKFTAKCQSCDIQTQYIKYGVRCFDLRIGFIDGYPCLTHGKVIYKYTLAQIHSDLKWLNDQKDAYVRVIHEARDKKRYTNINVYLFKSFCHWCEQDYPNIHFWCGRNLYNWKYDYVFNLGNSSEPSCEEAYSSVCSPKKIDDWWPWLFAKRKNHLTLQRGTKEDILLIDYVNIK